MSRDVITAPGLVGDMDEDWYHAGAGLPDSLSVSGAKKLLAPSCPAIFDYERRNPKPASKEMDLGTVVHGLVLGTGQPVEVLDADSWRTKAAQQWRDQAIADGSVPMLRHEFDHADRIAQAVLRHPTAGGLFSEGEAEQSGFWHDKEWDLWRRFRLDWLTWFGEYPTIVDLKSCPDASPEGVQKSIARFRYFMQHPWYADGLAAVLGIDPQDIEFLFVFVQVNAPHLVTIARLSDKDVALGRAANAEALERYRDCTDSGIWPAWSDDIIDISLPRWTEREIEKDIYGDDY